MTNTDQGMFTCRNISRIVGVLLGLVLFLLVGGLWGLILGIALAVAAAIGLERMFCAGTDATETHVDIPGTDDEEVADAKASAKTGSAEAAAAGGVDAATRTTPAAALGAGSTVATPQPAAEPEPKAAPEPKPDAEARAAQELADDKSVLAGDAGEGTRPEGLSGPRGGTADDLKLIRGVGPKLEVLLHELGYYHYDQIANWTGAEVAWVDKNLKGFKGRVSRDGWVEQARALASRAGD